METPLYSRLMRYNGQNRISFAMPGHKNGRGLPDGLICCDVTELAHTEDLHSPGKAIERSLELLAEKYGADESFILTGGSTLGVHAMIAAALKPGDTLVSFSDCHMSVVNACALFNIRLKFFSPSLDNDGHYAGFDEAELTAALEGASALIAASPDYYGRSKDIEKLAGICRAHGLPLLVDQAHGAHFAVSDIFPAPAPKCGADCTVMSAHKTLNALTGAAYLHINGNITDKRRIGRAVCALETSSPSYVIAASAETAALTMSRENWERTALLCDKLKSSVNLRALKNDDKTRLVFFTDTVSGFEAEKILADKFGIDIEMADAGSIVLIVTPSNTEKELDALCGALNYISSLKKRQRLIIPRVSPPEGVFSPAAGFFSESTETAFENAAGKTAACTVTSYPPGIPVICCGAVITEEAVRSVKELIGAGAKITGLCDGGKSVYTVKRL
ncbi:MAG TPA: aminotransferase class V-fold PLP-dependent enzyme [Candidatus Ornithomonoglobus intestinigallinarum]|uniref:Aminotransferase class V-fold PLP-dependent enzyme n=1 Tax=Candidatus Ornithomonoglobus intestinigallinarum TaxID=2840894 RepID=A0A9D1H3H1_9FIRM|nr:aminotransferase class V-fold PLP-dependent enzyme [Candidatus Ornithomonoglobus intestinigallinarum]